MIRDHVGHLHRIIDDQGLLTRGAIVLVSALALPLLGTGVRWVGDAFGLGRFVVPLLVLAHVPVVVALIAVWSIGCDVCRSGRSG